ncbi:MAG TPA: helix-turn-helix transcriptional regulator [Tepidiformaceae bacterium]|nr:helix-turn-helix transcriptional regulator [Tepidiformaceae bacterium]
MAKSTTTDPAGGEAGAARPRLHGEMLSTSLLAFLKNWNAYGYQLSQKLAEAGMPEFDSGTVYRTLRQLEKTGLVSSFWDTSESGPARRMYSLTAAGDLFLNGWIEALQRYQTVLQGALTDLAPKVQDPPSDAAG